MSKKENLRHLAMYRLKQAEESMDEAKYLFEGNKSPRSVINRPGLLCHVLFDISVTDL